MTDPAALAVLVWRMGWIVALRSAQLWTEPARAATALADMAAEKHHAFTAGAIAAGRAALLGQRPDLVAAAAFSPARRRVASNYRRLTRTR